MWSSLSYGRTLALAPIKPVFVAVGPDGTLCVSDGRTQCVQRVDPSQLQATWLGHPGQQGRCTVVGERAALRMIKGVAFAPDAASLYVADRRSVPD